jgi:hypothetical protein
MNFLLQILKDHTCVRFILVLTMKSPISFIFRSKLLSACLHHTALKFHLQMGRPCAWFMGHFTGLDHRPSNGKTTEKCWNGKGIQGKGCRLIKVLYEHLLGLRKTKFWDECVGQSTRMDGGDADTIQNYTSCVRTFILWMTLSWGDYNSQDMW